MLPGRATPSAVKSRKDVLQLQQDEHRFTQYFKDWTLGKLLGKGASAAVYECSRSSNPSEKGAVKVFRHEQAQAHETAVFRQVKVYRHLAKQKHQIGYDNIVHFIESAPSLIILELESVSVADSTTLTDLVLTEQALRDAARGLVFLYGVGVIHGDMKPENLLLKCTGRKTTNFICKITDMGGARFDDATEKAPSYVTFGTPMYMPPELLMDIFASGSYPFRKKSFLPSNLPVTTAGDIWAFGCIIYSLIIKAPAFSYGTSLAIEEGAISTRRDQILKDMQATSASLTFMVTGCLKMKRDERPNAAQLLNSFESQSHDNSRSVLNPTPAHRGRVAPASTSSFTRALGGFADSNSTEPFLSHSQPATGAAYSLTKKKQAWHGRVSSALHIASVVLAS